MRWIMAVPLLVCSTAAAANWKYTRWGMMPAEAKAASAGQAVDFVDPELNTSVASVKLATKHNTPTVEYLVSMSFDNRTGGLSSVTLYPRPKSDCPRMLSDLRATYGEPLPGKPGGIILLQSWEDRAAGNRLDALVIGSLDAPRECSLTYKPLKAATGL